MFAGYKLPIMKLAKLTTKVKITRMISRQTETIVRQKLLQTPAVVLLGPRQVGKTTLAKQIAANWPGGAVYLDLERPADRLRLQDADAYLRAQRGKLVIMDEIHRAPDVFEVLRGIIDDNRQEGLRSGQFLLLGSAALDLMRQSSETLAGRVAYLDIAPLNILEAAPAGIKDADLWVRGGFPDSLLATDDTQSLDWRRDFIRSCLERDVPMFAPRLPAETIGRRVPYFYRTQAGAEIDLLLEKGGLPEIAIEIKRSTVPSPERGFALACDDLKIEQRYIVYPGTERIPLRHGAQAIGLQELATLLQQ
jgi:predicted AAA+ superfamily ATPase